MPTAPRKIVYKPLSEVVPALRNPKRHDLDELARSVARFGLIDMQVEDGRTGKLISGHGRLETLAAAEAAGLEPPDGVRVVKGRWQIPIVVGWSSSNDEEADAALVAVNHLTETGGWNSDELATMLRGITDLTGTAYTPDDIAALIGNDPGAAGDELTDRDAIPRAPTAATTKAGDLWELGPHRLVCADATEAASYERLMNGAPAAAIVTDPPYNVDYEGGTADALTILNDAMPIDVFARFLHDAFVAMSEPLVAGGAAYVFHADGNGNAFRNAYSRAGLVQKQILVWIKDRFVLSRQDYNWQHEPIIYGWKPGAAHRWFGGYTPSTLIADDDRPLDQWSKPELVEMLEQLRSCSTVQRERRPTRSEDHPTAKPVALLQRLIVNSTRPDEIVLDPFAGSGSTLIACHATSRISYNLELDPKYCDVIIRRWEEHTGIIATLANGTKRRRK